MAEKIKLLEDYLTCSVCLEMFKEPVSLGCNHSFCRSCVQDYWEKNQTRNCPVCRRRWSKDLGINFALKELCSSFSEKLEVSEGAQRQGGGGSDRTVLPEKAQKLLEQLQTELQSLRAERQSYTGLEETYDEMVQFNKKQAKLCERQIRAEFQRLHSFLEEEQHRALSALREEHLTQTHNMDLELQKVKEKLSSLSNSIQELEKHLQTGSSSPETQSPAPRLRPKAGLLLDQAKVLGNLGFRVWSNMRRIISYSPVILDPNTADRRLCLSEDLRAVRWGDTDQKVPDNPERFSFYAEVLGCEGFSSGSHQWDVEVGDHPDWVIGVAKESVERKGKRTASPENGIWALLHYSGKYINCLGETVPVQTLKRLRVKLDYDLGEVSFYEADHMTFLYKHSDSFTEKLFPYFFVGEHEEAETTELRILTCDPQTQTQTRTRTQTQTQTQNRTLLPLRWT